MEAKNNKLKGYFKILVSFFISLVIELVILLLIINITVTPTYIQENNIIEDKCKSEVLQKVVDTAYDVSNHSYKWNTYDCSEFSEELVKQLRLSGISAYCVSGIVKDENKWIGHTWVEVIIEGQTYPLESTGGFIIDNETYKEKYKILKKGFCF